MRVGLVVVFIFFGTLSGFATDIFRIEVGKDHQKYSDSDLRRRVWELERAVYQLQNRVFQLEGKPQQVAAGETWLCTVKARGTSYTGTGATKAGGHFQGGRLM